jgi:hypothetical protein
MKVPELTQESIAGADCRYEQLATYTQKATDSTDKCFCWVEEVTGNNNETILVFYTSPAAFGRTVNPPLSAREVARALSNRLEDRTVCRLPCPDTTKTGTGR